MNSNISFSSLKIKAREYKNIQKNLSELNKQDRETFSQRSKLESERELVRAKHLSESEKVYIKSDNFIKNPDLVKFNYDELFGSKLFQYIFYEDQELDLRKTPEELDELKNNLILPEDSKSEKVNQFKELRNNLFELFKKSVIMYNSFKTLQKKISEQENDMALKAISNLGSCKILVEDYNNPDVIKVNIQLDNAKSTDEVIKLLEDNKECFKGNIILKEKDYKSSHNLKTKDRAIEYVKDIIQRLFNFNKSVPAKLKATNVDDLIKVLKFSKNSDENVEKAKLNSSVTVSVGTAINYNEVNFFKLPTSKD